MSEFDLDKFKMFYNEFYRRSCQYVKSYVRDDLVAEDIASESLIKLWELSLSKEIANPKAISFTVLKNRPRF